MTEPLTPEEERTLRNALARGEPIIRYLVSSQGVRHLADRLLATLDAERAARPGDRLREAIREVVEFDGPSIPMGLALAIVRLEKAAALSAPRDPAPAPALDADLIAALRKFVTGEGAMATDPDGDCYFCEAEGVDYEPAMHGEPGSEDGVGEHEPWCLVTIARAVIAAPAPALDAALRKFTLDELREMDWRGEDWRAAITAEYAKDEQR